MRRVVFLLAFLVSLPAMACDRSQQMVRMAGIDPDEMRCLAEVLQQQRTASDNQTAVVEAQRRLAMADLKKAQDDNAKAGEAIKWWGECVKDAACVAWAIGK